MTTKQKNNPFFINPGRIPDNCIPRYDIYADIIDTFCGERPGEYGVFITGVRGTGKTVLLNQICDKLTEEGFLSVRLNPLLDTYASAIDSLRNDNSVRNILQKTKFKIGANITSVFSAEINFEEMDVVTKEGLLRDIAKELTAKNERIVFSIDDVTKCKELTAFAQTIQTMVGFDKSSVFVLLTGLPEEVLKIKRNKNASFIARLREITTEPLSEYAIKNGYKKLLSISDEEAKTLLPYVQGYPYGYQLLGYILWEQRKIKVDDDIIERYKEMLFASQYDLIWDTFSSVEKKVIVAIAKATSHKSDEIIRIAEMDSNMFNQYRINLKKRGLISTKEWGKVTFTLPLFAEYAMFVG